MIGCFVKAKVESGLEELIVGNLVDNKEDARYVELIPVQLLEKSNSYDPKKLVELALEQGQQNRLGYLAELALELAEIHKLEGIEEKKDALRYISAELESRMSSTYSNILSGLPEFAQEFDEERYKDADELRKKWKMITDLTPERLDDYMDIYLTRKNIVKEYVPPNSNLR